MRLYQHRGYYYTYHKGIRKSLKTKDKAVAESLYRKLELEYLEQEISMDLWPKKRLPQKKHEVFSSFKPDTPISVIADKVLGKDLSTYGYVYIASNPAFLADYKKVGMTMVSPEERMQSLSQCTSVPHPFKLECLYIVKDCIQFEKDAHKILDRFRVSKTKEFFDVPFHVARHLIKEKTNVFQVHNGTDWIKLAISHRAEEIMNGPWEECEMPEEFEEEFILPQL
jgi:hypothetical protein